jgi:hypothetical protein
MWSSCQQEHIFIGFNYFSSSSLQRGRNSESRQATHFAHGVAQVLKNSLNII